MKLLSFFLMVKWRFHFCRMRPFLKSRFAGKMIDRLHYSRLKKGARAFSHIIRCFTIKSEISKVTRSALTLQYSLSYLVGRKKRSRLRNGAATRIQCLFRSWICRDHNAVIVYELASKRKNRLIGRVVLTLQSRHRSRLVRSRKAQLVEAAQCLQHWCKGLREREAFLLKRRLACMLQQLVRRSLAILRVHNHRAAAMLKLEAVHNDLVRNEELSTVRTLHPCELRLGQISSRQGHKRVSRYLIGFDVTFDVGAAYPGGWIVTLMRFTEMLSREKRTLVHVAIGGQHTILVDDNSNIYSFGFGDHGQLGHGNRRKQPNPNRLATSSSSGPKLNGLRGSGSRFVCEICCGSS
jgi:Regulator of chromosome condensation (RCC1) repeat